MGSRKSNRERPRYNNYDEEDNYDGYESDRDNDDNYEDESYNDEYYEDSHDLLHLLGIFFKSMSNSKFGRKRRN